MCRCSETARLAFGRVQAIPSLMGNWAETNRSMDDAGRDLVQLVKTNVQAGTNTVLVAHFSNAFRAFGVRLNEGDARSEEHTSELQSLMRISYAVFCLKKKQHCNTQLRIPSN